MSKSNKSDVFKVDFKVSVDRELVFGLLVSAFEGGSNYWYWIEESNIDELGVKYYPDVALHDNGWISICDKELVGESDVEYWKLDKKALSQGLEIMASDYPRRFAEAVIEQNYDAGDADIFLQLCLFGKLVYG